MSDKLKIFPDASGHLPLVTIHSHLHSEQATFEMAPDGKYTVQASSNYATYSRTAINFPHYVGGYQMGDIRFNLTRKPSAWHRWWVRFTLGWVWEDAK